ncbi:methyltransferase domain-containing protein [Methanolobus mangrovi]|uniref:Methyltransferase domain-containing protein n=1 Tax=Methanolobus mangrovi TaxID=3072977 RepID=A0AA51YG61_9EURY|nr:methyltransferase domain-containing protein [Methanolobus mangrovi]WMW21676.1 methyltransferase domain-containing protein [Methanolobus mangrovi]
MENSSFPGNGSKSHFFAWDEEYKHVTWGGPRSISMLEGLISPSSRVLDLGCGNGRFLLPLSRKYESVGIDVSATAVHRARSYISKNNSKDDAQAECIVSSITSLPFSDNSFDAILCLGVVQHLMQEERKVALSEIRRVMKSGAILVIEVFGTEDMRYGGDEIEKHTFRRKNGIIYHYFTEDELASLLCGFQIIEMKAIVSEKRFSGELHKRHQIRAIARIQNAIPR